MTTSELHKILDDENKKLSLKELREVIYELKNDVLTEYRRHQPTDYRDGYYIGESNAFQIVLDLLEHLEVENVEDKR